jgi:hypothetical protein
MKKSFVFGLLLVGAASFGGLVVSTTASAQDAKAAGGEAAGATAYDFDDDLVTGDLMRPDGEQLLVRRRGNRASLIQIREHFIPEMLKSVEDL